LHLAIGPAIGSQWLMPKIGDFFQKHRDLEIKFVTRYVQPVDFSGEDLDAATYSGNKYDDSLNFDLLFHDNIIPVCAPGFLKSHAIRRPRDLLQLPLLHEATRMNAWPDWFAANNVLAKDLRGQTLEHFYIVTHAAIAGLGVAVLPTFAIQSELQRRDLVTAIDRPIVPGKANYLVSPKEKSNRRPLRIFRTWLLAQSPPTFPAKIPK
jgi:LysR family glycine cleavage system transcriptional activator